MAGSCGGGRSEVGLDGGSMGVRSTLTLPTVGVSASLSPEEVPDDDVDEISGSDSAVNLQVA